MIGNHPIVITVFTGSYIFQLSSLLMALLNLTYALLYDLHHLRVSENGFTILGAQIMAYFLLFFYLNAPIHLGIIVLYLLARWWFIL